ncbi:transcription factor EGL1 [Pyrus x bretschneideri]|uniref:transcription factor EGL1 n=1 Tax=Pyrus x bretschneideri TaxID=225117 RepID=UPI002030AE17|nr:transcription factor EGL1 [Pyrus x bretschneideri]
MAVPENLIKQLALSVRSIQWSYGIFWSISARQPGVLEWGDGYYNGDIKTRKTVQAVELDADQMGLQRSEQLRELYDSLSVGEASPQARRPSASLSPEDLADTEWYYLVCMSFVFNIGQGLPGRTLANGKPTWLCNAHYVDSKVFSRSLLAKSASIQTVVCFPFLGGVIELGVTELVLEDPSLIQHVKTSFLEAPYPIIASKRTNPSAGSTRHDNDLACAVLDDDIVDTKLIPVVGYQEMDVTSPDDSSNGLGPNQPADDSFMVEGMNGGASQVQSWQFMDDELSNFVHHSMDSSDCISQTLVYPEKVLSGPKTEKANDHCPQEHKECNSTKKTSLDPQGNDLQYKSVLSALLKSSHQLVLGPHFQNSHQESSFTSWKRGGFVKCRTQRGGTPQKLLKKILLEVPQMHVDCVLEPPEDTSNVNEVCRPEADDIDTNHALSERRRREKLNERFCILKSMVPSVSKEDKVSILDDTIEHLKDLEKRVEELESFRELTNSDSKMKRKLQETVERTSDNCCNPKISNAKKPIVYKRKASDVDETEPEINHIVSKNVSSDNITVNTNNKDVLIEMKFPWREGVLLEIMDATSRLHLDAHSVQSSTADGILSLTIKSRFKGTSIASAGTIKQALDRFARS